MNINLSCSSLLFFNKLTILESATLFSQERRTRSRKPQKKVGVTTVSVTVQFIRPDF